MGWGLFDGSADNHPGIGHNIPCHKTRTHIYLHPYLPTVLEAEEGREALAALGEERVLHQQQRLRVQEHARADGDALQHVLFLGGYLFWWWVVNGGWGIRAVLGWERGCVRLSYCIMLHIK